MKILITGFRPFGRRKNNTSEDVLQNLRKNLPRQNDVTCHFLILPVNFRTAWPTLKQAIDGILPDTLLMLGEKNGKHATLETTAHNRRRHKTGEIPIEKTNSKKLHTIFNAADLLAAPQKSSAPAKQRWNISHNAGNYLCNFSYWKVLARRPKLPAIFLHVPALSTNNSQVETTSIAHEIKFLIEAIQKQLRNIESKVSAQKQLTVPGQKAGRAKRKKES